MINSNRVSERELSERTEKRFLSSSEVGAFYWTVPAPDIVNLGREE